MVKAVAALYFVVFIVAAIDIIFAILTDKDVSQVLGFTADLFSLFLSVLIISILAFVISIPVKPTN